MTDAEFQAQRERIEPVAQRWIAALGLGFWSITLVWAREDYHESEPGTPRSSIARCKADWRYAHATITFNVPKFVDEDDDDLEGIVVHELMHVFLSEARWVDGEDSDSLDHEERVATMLAKAFRWAIQPENGLVKLEAPVPLPEAA